MKNIVECVDKVKIGISVSYENGYMEKIEELIAPWKGKLNVAAHNSPGVNTISGEASALEEAMEVFKEQKVKARKLVVSHAFHSHLMDPMLDEFRDGRPRHHDSGCDEKVVAGKGGVTEEIS